MFGGHCHGYGAGVLSAAVGLLDYNLVYVNLGTYPVAGHRRRADHGRGLSSAATAPARRWSARPWARSTASLFVLGVLFGICLADGRLHEEFWHSSYLGRFTIPEWLGLPHGVVVVPDRAGWPCSCSGGASNWRRSSAGAGAGEPKWRIYAGGGLLGLALLTAFIGQPTTEQKMVAHRAPPRPAWTNREVQIHPPSWPDDDRRHITDDHPRRASGGRL